MHTLEVTCTDLAYGGAAFGRLSDGRMVFVPYALPGERVQVRLVKEKAGYAEAELIAVLTPAPERIVPRCSHFGECGGCHYQHMLDKAQLEAKTHILRDQLKRLGNISDPPVQPAVPSPRSWGYRNHMQFHYTPDGRLGLQAGRTNQVVKIQECYLPEPTLASAWHARNGSAKKKWKDGARERMRVASDGSLQTDSPVKIDVLTHSFRVSPDSFFQVNVPMAERMVAYVLAHLPQDPRATVVDVYCGVGLFSIFLAPHVGRLIGIESSSSACADYRFNLAANTNVELYEADAETALASLGGPVQAMIVDPPRAGLGKSVVEQLLRISPHTMAYVSCDPATMARDARQLVAGGYSLKEITPFDLFPQTYHIESIGIWTRQVHPSC